MIKIVTLFLASLLVVCVSSKAIEQVQENEFQQMDPRIINFATDFWNLIIAEPINSLTSSLAGMAAQIVAGVALNGLGVVGKRDADIDVNEIMQQINQQIDQQLQQTLSQIQAQLQALIAQNNLPKGALDDLFNSIKDQVYNSANQAIKDLFLNFTSSLINFAQGKRDVVELRGFWSDLLDKAKDQLYEVANNAVQQTFMTVTQQLINFSQGKREIDYMRGFWSDILDKTKDQLFQVANTAVQNTFMTITQQLINFSQGKRETKFLGDLISAVSNHASNAGTHLFNIADNLVQAGAFQLLNVLAHVSENGLLPTIGKRGLALDNAEKNYNNNGNSVDSLVHQILTLISQAQNQKPLTGGSGSHMIGK